MASGDNRFEQAERIGWGSLAELTGIMRELRPRSVLLVAHERVLRATGADDGVRSSFAGTDVRLFADFATNPQAAEIERAAALCSATRPGLIVAIGGGTAIDVAKGIRGLASGSASLHDLLSGEAVPGPSRIPLVAVPTTSGSGSEATQFAVVYVEGKKQSLDHPSVRPDVAIVDAALTATLPPAITACTGMDALAQAMESIWSVASSAESEVDAVASLRLTVVHLKNAVLAPARADREAMALAAHLAGRAINRTRTTAAHAASYPITSRHGIPHGHAVALTLPQMLVFNDAVSASDVLDPRGPDAVRRRIRIILDELGASDAEEGRGRLLALIRAIGLATSLDELGIRDVDPLVDEGFTPSRVANNPRLVTPDALARMLSWRPT